jgi:hypothetical protein
MFSRLIAAFVGVHQIIRFNQDLIIIAFNVPKRMMVSDQKNDAVVFRFRQAFIRKELPCQDHSFAFLMLTVGIAVFPSAQRTGDIMKNGCDFQDFLRLRIQPFAFSDCLRIAMYFQEMTDVVQVSVRILNHFLHDFRTVHRCLP